MVAKSKTVGVLDKETHAYNKLIMNVN